MSVVIVPRIYITVDLVEIIDPVVIEIDKIVIVVLVVNIDRTHILPRINMILLALDFDEIGKLLLDVIGPFDIGEIKIAHPLIGRIKVKRSGPYDSLPEAPGQCEVCDPVQPHFILPQIENTALDEQPVRR